MQHAGEWIEILQGDRWFKYEEWRQFRSWLGLSLDDVAAAELCSFLWVDYTDRTVKINDSFANELIMRAEGKMQAEVTRKLRSG